MEEFIKNMILRVNIVGVGRLAIALGADIYMEAKQSRKRNDRIYLYTRQISLTNARVFYKETNMWIAAVDAEEAIDKAYSLMEKSAMFYIESMQEISENLEKVGIYQPEIKRKNSELINNILDVLNGD